MRRLVLAVSTVLMVVMIAAPAFAQLDGNPKFALHLAPPVSKIDLCTGGVTPNDIDLPCSGYTTSAGLEDKELYLVIMREGVADTSGTTYEGITGASFGITYDDGALSGMDILGGVKNCFTGLEFSSDDPLWPASGSGIRLTWEPCEQTVIGGEGVHAVALAMSVYAYSPDTFAITPHRALLSGTELIVADCAGSETELDTTGAITAFVEFGGGTGCNPCEIGIECSTPTRPQTWGRIKSLYLDDN